MSGERKMWDYLRPKLKPYGHFERIESHETAIGTPDIDYCIRGYNNKLELKYTEKDKGCVLRPSQCSWFKRRVKAEGQPWLLLHANIRGKRSYSLIAGADVPALVNTKDVVDWIPRATIVWQDGIDIGQLVQFLGTFLVVDSPDSNGGNPGESSGLILPSRLRTS